MSRATELRWKIEVISTHDLSQLNEIMEGLEWSRAYMQSTDQVSLHDKHRPGSLLRSYHCFPS
jgi:hypothetical protein